MKGLTKYDVEHGEQLARTVVAARDAWFDSSRDAGDDVDALRLKHRDAEARLSDWALYRLLPSSELNTPATARLDARIAASMTPDAQPSVSA
jgi:hypothetical protein